MWGRQIHDSECPFIQISSRLHFCSSQGSQFCYQIRIGSGFFFFFESSQNAFRLIQNGKNEGSLTHTHKNRDKCVWKKEPFATPLQFEISTGLLNCLFNKWRFSTHLHPSIPTMDAFKVNCLVMRRVWTIGYLNLGESEYFKVKQTFFHKPFLVSHVAKKTRRLKSCTP